MPDCEIVETMTTCDNCGLEIRRHTVGWVHWMSNAAVCPGLQGAARPAGMSLWDAETQRMRDKHYLYDTA